jgi:hypothetical protein
MHMCALQIFFFVVDDDDDDNKDDKEDSWQHLGYNVQQLHLDDDSQKHLGYEYDRHHQQVLCVKKYFSEIF